VVVLGATVTTSYDAEGRPRRSLLSEESVLEGAETSASVKIFFSRYLLPHKVIRQSACLHPTSTTITSIADCTDPSQRFAEPAYDPTDRSVTYRLPAGDRLAVDTQYRLSIFVATSLDDSGFFAFDGAPVDRPYTFDFRTQAADSTAEERLPTPDAYCAQVECFAPCTKAFGSCADMCATTETACKDMCTNEGCEDECEETGKTCDTACQSARRSCEQPCRATCILPPTDPLSACYANGDFVNEQEVRLFDSCSFSPCHGSPVNDGSTISAGLDLRTASAIEQTAIGWTAHQTQVGQSSIVGDQSPQRFGRAMPLIDPGNPGNSYIMYKMLANPLNHLRLSGALDEGLAFEIDRLAGSVVVGLPMPAQSGSGLPQGFHGDDPEGRKSFQQMQLISAWIAHGAVTSCP